MVPSLVTSRSTDDAGHASALLRELVATHDRFPALFNEHPAGMVLFDRHGNLVRANRAAVAFLGVGIEDLFGRRYGAFIARSERESARNAFAKAAAGATVAVETKVSVASGEVHTVAMTLAPAIVERTIVGVYGSAQPTTDPATRKLQELTSLFANNADAVIVFESGGRCVDANAASEKLTGYAPAELRGRNYRSLLAPGARPAGRDVFARVMAGESVSTDTVFVARDGHRVDVSGTSIPIVVDGQVVGAYTIGRDVTAQRRLESALREQTERMRELYLLAARPDETAETKIVAALELGCRRLGCDAGYVTRTEDDRVAYLYGLGDGPGPGPTEPLGGSMHELVLEKGKAVTVDGYERAGCYAFAGVPIELGGTPAGALLFMRVRPREQPFSDVDRDFVGLIGTLVSSTLERNEQRRRAEQLAFHDPLTGLPNRTLLRDRLDQAIATADRHHAEFAVHFYDLDFFKTINDQHGHMRGDDVLCEVARRFLELARNEDTVARIGGDEFIVVQPGITSRGDAETLARRLQDALSDPLTIDGATYRLTGSVGIAVFPTDGRDAETLLARADAALYHVKQNGRDDVAFFSSPS